MSNYNTYARAVISDNPVIAEYIEKYARESSTYGEQGAKHFGMLSDEQIDRAFKDPHSKYITKFILHLPQFLVMQQQIEEMLEEVARQSTFLEHVALDLDNKVVTDPDVDEANKAMRNLETVDTEYRRLLDIHIDILKQKEELQKGIKALNDLLSKQGADWDAFRNKQLQALIDNLLTSNVELIEEEKQQILAPETWSEIVERFRETKLTVPKHLDLETPNMLAYYQLKDILAKQASLGRRMLPNTMVEIEKL